MSKITVPNSEKKMVGLTRSAHGLLALEPRFMFDGAAVDMVADKATEVSVPVNAAIFQAEAVTALRAEIVQKAQVDIKAYLANKDALSLYAIFGDPASQPSAAWIESAQNLINDVLLDRVSVQVKSLADGQMLGALGAFSAGAEQDTPVIYLNDRLLQSADNQKTLERVLVEEFGHFMDVRINAARDSVGDEGQLFAAQILGADATSQFADTENDSAKIQVGDVLVDVELASAPEVSVTFDKGYFGIQGTNTNQANDIYNLSSKGITRIAFVQTDANGDGKFGDGGTQGNDLAGTLRITLADGSVHNLAGALNWRETTGSKVEVFGFILNDGQSLTRTFTVGGTEYNLSLTGGTTNSVSSTIGLQAFNSTWTFTNLEDRSGNAATSGLLKALNDYLDLTPQPLSISANSVTEGQSLVYTVTLDSTTTTSFTYPFTLSYGTGFTADDYSGALSSSNFSNGVTLNADGTITVPTGVTSFTITLATVSDAFSESRETATVTIGAKSATGSVVDAGTDTINVTSYSPVNEGSTYAMFTVEASGSQELKLSVLNGTTELVNPTIQYLSGESWVTYVEGTSMPTGGTVYVRVAISSESDDTYEGPEDFSLVATNSTNAAITDTESTYIVDDGTGSRYDGALTAGIPNSSGISLDDDRSITVTGLDDVSEGSNAVFTVTLEAARSAVTEITLALANGQGSNDAAESGDYVATYSNDGSDATKAAVYYYVGSVQTFLSVTDGKINLPANVTTFYVRVPSTQDTSFEGKEDFQLTATVTSGKSGADTSTIVDDGSGKVYDDKGANGTGPGNDDRPVLSINDATVEEGSKAVFTVSLSNASEEALEIEFTTSVTDPLSAEAGDIDPASLVVTYFNGTIDVVLTPTDGKYTIPAGVMTLTVKVPTVGDAVYEGSETFTLSANVTQSYVTDTDLGTGTIKDDGTAADGDDEGAGVDNDKPVLSINDATVEEGSKAVFTVSLSNASEEALEIEFTTSVTDPLSAEAGDIDPASLVVTYFNGTIDVVLTPTDGKYTIPAGVMTLTVKVPTVSDAVYEGSETFTLSANVTQSYVTDTDLGTGTIKDDGTAADGDDEGSGQDNDKPVLSINDATVEEGSKAVFTVSLSNASEEALEIEFTTSVTDPLSAEAGDIDPANLVVTYNDGTNDVVLTATAGKYTIPAGVTVLTVKVPTVGDAVYEGSETFTLSANVTQSYVTDTDLGTGTIKDDGTATDGDDEGAGVDNDKPVLSINDATVEEGSKAVFTVSLSNASEEALEIEFTTSVTDPLSAEAGDIDPANLVVTYNDGTNDVVLTATAGKYTIPAGVTVLTVKVPTVGDAVYEGSETFTLSANVTQSYVTDTDLGTGTIKDDGTAADGDDEGSGQDNDKPVLSINDATVEEGSKAVFTVSLSNAAEEALEISFSTSVTDPLSAEAGDIDPTGLVVTYRVGESDVVLTPTDGKYTIPAGVTTLTVKVPTVGDAVYEGSETFTLSANVTQSYVTDTDLGTGTIKDDGTATDGDDEGAGVDNDKPVLSINDATVEEGSKAVFTVSLSNASEEALEIEFTTSVTDPLSAEAGDIDPANLVVTYNDGTNDVVLTATAGKYTIPAGVTVLTVKVPTVGDAVYEGSETFTLSANVTQSYVTDTDLGTGTIKDDGTATDGDDEGAGVDNDKPVLSINDATVEEGSKAVFTVSLSNASEEALEIEFTTSVTDPLSAEAGDIDPANLVVTYNDGTNDVVLTATAGKYTIPAGVTVLTVKVPTVGDAVYEGSETFTLSANVTQSYVTDTDLGTGTIKDDGTAADGDDEGSGQDNDKPVLSINDATVEEGSKAVFTVSLSNAAEEALEISFSTSVTDPLSAEAGDIDPTGLVVTYRVGESDVVLTPTDGKYTIPAGVTTLTVKVPTVGDAVYEGSETFTLSANVTQSYVTDTDLGTGTIKDDGTAADGDDEGSGQDNDKPVLSINDATVEEGSKAVFTVSLSNASEEALEIEFTTSVTDPLSAEAGDIDPANLVVTYNDGTNDVVLTATAGKYTIPAGVTVLTVKVPTVGDAVYEGSETFTLSANVTQSYVTDTDLGTGTIKDDGTATDGDDEGAGVDNDKPVLSINDATVEEGSKAVFTVSLSNASEEALEIEFTTSVTDPLSAEAGDIDPANLVVTYNDGTNDVVLTATAGKYTIPAGVTVLTVKVPTVGDAVYEGSETFTLSANVTQSYVTDTDIGTGTIKDDGTATDGDDANETVDNDTPVLSINDATVEEGSKAVFTVSLSNAAEEALEISFSTSVTDPLSAEAGDIDPTGLVVTYRVGESDVVLTPTDGKYTIPAGVTTLTVKVPTVGDAVYEGSETFTLSANVTQSYVTDTDIGTGTIKDDGTATDGDDANETVDNDTPVLSINDATVEEGSKAVFTVSLSNASEEALEIEFTTSVTDPLTAEAGDIDPTNLVVTYNDGTNDVVLTATAGKYTIPAGVTVLTVKVPTVSDAVYEGSETFTLSANVTQSYVTDTDIGTGTIKDDGTAMDGDDEGVAVDDDRPVLSVAGVDDVSEGSYAVFAVSLDKALEATTVIDLGLAHGTTEVGDYNTTYVVYTDPADVAGSTLTVTSNSVTVAAGVTRLYVAVQSNVDAVYEGAENFSLTATFASAAIKYADRTGTDSTLRTGASGSDTSTIVDDGSGRVYSQAGVASGTADDDRPVLSVAGVDDVSEGSYAVFTVSLDKALEGTTGIKLSLTDSSALIATDLSSMTMEVVTSLSTAVGSGTPVDNDATFTLPAETTKFYVRVLTKSDQPAVYEGAEKFALRASFTSAALLYADRTGVNAAVRANASNADTSTILDDGTGKVYKPDGTEDLDAIKDDDRPKPEPLPLAVLPPAAPDRLAERVEPPPPVPQVFSSTLDPVAPRLVPIEPPRPIGDVLTSQSGYRIPVNDAAAPGLSLNRGVTDQFVQGTQVATKISLPFDAFVHSDKDAVIKLEAKQADNRSLPKWVQFDPVSGVFEVTPPKGFKGKLDLKVVARDDDGREATALFQLFVGEQEKVGPQSRESFSEKLRMAGKRPITLIRVSDAQSKVTVRESMSQKVRPG